MLGHAASLITALPASPAPLLWPVLELPASSLLPQPLVVLEPLMHPTFSLQEPVWLLLHIVSLRSLLPTSLPIPIQASDSQT